MKHPFFTYAATTLDGDSFDQCLSFLHEHDAEIMKVRSLKKWCSFELFEVKAKIIFHPSDHKIELRRLEGCVVTFMKIFELLKQCIASHAASP